MNEWSVFPQYQNMEFRKICGKADPGRIRSYYLESKYNKQMNRSKVAVTGVNAGM